MPQEQGKHVIVVGCGAIGSFLVPLLARMPGITRVTLVDPDAYELANLRGQNIFCCDVRELKVAVQARRLRALNPHLDVAAIPAAVGDLPLGSLRADLIVACVDTLQARLDINQIASRLGVPWIDSGVLESEKLARVNVYVPAADAACHECALSDEDYKSLEVEYPCGVAVPPVTPSDSSAVLASLAASLVAGECQKMLNGDLQHAVIGRQVTMDARTHRMFSTTFRRNPACRLTHGSWTPVPLRHSLRRLTVGDTLAITGRISVPGHRFVRATVCPQCCRRLDGLRLDRPKARCPKCNVRMIAPAFDALLDQLDTSLPQECLDRSLAQIGLVSGDIVCGTEKQFELLAEVM